MRVKSLVVCLMSLLAAMIACNTPGASITAEVPTVVESTPQLIVVTATPPAATMGPVATATFSLPPTSAATPSFSHGITFAETPDVSLGAREFHGGVVRVYALWQYFNMKDGLSVRRDWYREGEIWITRSEPWDFAKYGANGTVKDISIYDTDDGLPSGHYELRLYIDEVAQFLGADDVSLRSFDIAEPADGGS